jgi:hypothetical protein
MWIRTRPASASISLEARAPSADRPAAITETVSFRLLPTNERDHLDLDTGEVFQDYSYARIRKNHEKLISASLTIRVLPDESYYKHNAMHYMAAVEGDEFSRSATIMFDAFLAPAAFREVADKTRDGLLPETITFELMSDLSFIFRTRDEPEKKRALEYGWEPDGSGVIWHNKEDENKRLAIDSIRFDYAIMKPRYDEQLNVLLPANSVAPTDRISNQIAVILTMLVAVLKYLRWAMIGIVALAIMAAIFIAKQSR